MKQYIKKIKNKLFLIFALVIFSLIFFSYNITLTYDSSEYLGLADVLGTEQMTQNWIAHRGIGFPLLLKIFKPFGIENQIFMLILMFAFFIGLILSIYMIYNELKKIEFFKNKSLVYVFITYILLFVIFNPIIFGYYHTLLTEFVAITLTIVTCYLSWKWIDFSWKENKKSIIIYTVLFSIILTFVYHIKQSLVVLTIIPILVATFISLLHNFKIENIVNKGLTIVFILLTLFFSIKIWNLSMANAKVKESVEQLRLKDKLIVGITNLNQICNESNIMQVNINRDKISNEDNEEIEKIMQNNSNYNKFKIFESSNESYLVYYSKEDYSFKEVLIFYMKAFFNNPFDIIESYYKGYLEIIIFRDNAPLWIAEENFAIPIRIHLEKLNIIDVNEDYIKYVENYVRFNKNNIVSKVFTVYVNISILFFYAYTKINLLILPFLWLIILMIYFIIRNKIERNTLKVLQLILILNTTSFLSIMSYVVLGAYVDRYTVPMMIPVFLANFMTAILFINILKEKFAKKHN